MHRIRCAEIWEGIENRDDDVSSAGITASIYSSAYEAEEGGDIYYFSVCENDLLTRVAIADVAGHGERVSAISQWLYDILHARMNDTDCGEILTSLNQSVTQHGISALTTAAVIGFYIKDSNFYFAYAGHGPVLLRRKMSKSWEKLELDDGLVRHPNGPLGVIPDISFDQQTRPLESGDQLFLHTDGLTEAVNPHGEFFGVDRLVEVLNRNAAAELPSVKQAVLDALSQHASGASFQDDITLLALEIN